MFDVEKTPARIADAALTCFAYEDYSATSLSKIAAAADTSKQVVLHHFRSKEQLYSEVLDNVCSELMRALEEARLAVNSPSEQLERFLLTLLDAGNEEVSERISGVCVFVAGRIFSSLQNSLFSTLKHPQSTPIPH